MVPLRAPPSIPEAGKISPWAILGLIVGLLVANLVALPLSIFLPSEATLPSCSTWVLGYIGIRLFLKRREEIQGMWSTTAVSRSGSGCAGRGTGTGGQGRGGGRRRRTM